MATISTGWKRIAGLYQTHGIYDPQLEFRVPAHRLDGAQLMRKMMSMSTPPTAVFIADPLTACGAINEARKLGLRIPEEMSILGFDDSDSRFSVEPTMTAICQDSRELGRLAYRAARSAMRWIERCSRRANSARLGWRSTTRPRGPLPSRFELCQMANACLWLAKLLAFDN